VEITQDIAWCYTTVVGVWATWTGWCSGVTAEKREDGAEIRCGRGIGARVTKPADGDAKAVIVCLQPRRAYDGSAA
jgi:hypothetical protein